MPIFSKETDMQDWLSDELKNSDGIADLIVDLEVNRNPLILAEEKIAISYEHCIKSLYINTVISEDENISLKKGDVLRPDFMLFAPETESMVIVELKNISNPTRQVGTELGAYASEIRTYVPFISDGDIVNVIVSPEWPTLLRHYIFNEIFWNQNNILCLEPVTESGEIRLKIIDPANIVEDDILLKLGNHHLGGFQICLYENNNNSCFNSGLNRHIEQMKTSISAMASKGNSLGNNGFAFLWKRKQKSNFTNFNITLLNFAAFQSLDRFIMNDEISIMTDKFIKITGEFNPIGHGQSLSDIADYGVHFLENFCSPRYEGFSHWEDLKEYMMDNTDLISFHGWGVFDNLFSEMLSNEYNSGNLKVSATDPHIGLKLIDDLVDLNIESLDLSYYNYSPSETDL